METRSVHSPHWNKKKGKACKNGQTQLVMSQSLRLFRSVEQQRTKEIVWEFKNLQIFTVKSSGIRQLSFKWLSGINNYKFQLIQNFITHIVVGTRKFDHITPVLKENGCGFCTKKSFLTDVSAIHKSLHDYWRPGASRPNVKIFFGMPEKL